MTKNKVKKYMLMIVNDHIDRSTSEVNCTSLAEAAASHFNQADEGGPLDDPDHWIWEIAVDVAKIVEG